MLGKIKPNQQQKASQIKLTDSINLAHPLVKLAQELDWNKMELAFEHLYSKQGIPLIPIRKIAGLLFLRQMFKQSD